MRGMVLCIGDTVHTVHGTRCTVHGARQKTVAVSHYRVPCTVYRENHTA
jgi:hypothetical protein